MTAVFSRVLGTASLVYDTEGSAFRAVGVQTHDFQIGCHIHGPPASVTDDLHLCWPQYKPYLTEARPPLDGSDTEEVRERLEQSL